MNQNICILLRIHPLNTLWMLKHVVRQLCKKLACFLVSKQHCSNGIPRGAQALFLLGTAHSAGSQSALMCGVPLLLVQDWVLLVNVKTFV